MYFGKKNYLLLLSKCPKPSCFQSSVDLISLLTAVPVCCRGWVSSSLSLGHASVTQAIFTVSENCFVGGWVPGRQLGSCGSGGGNALGRLAHPATPTSSMTVGSSRLYSSLLFSLYDFVCLVRV